MNDSTKLSAQDGGFEIAAERLDDLPSAEDHAVWASVQRTARLNASANLIVKDDTLALPPASLTRVIVVG
jgi:hypothetical protein